MCVFAIHNGGVSTDSSAVNTAILGTVGYYSYVNWDKPSWDRRTVSAVVVGLLTLWGGEGWVYCSAYVVGCC